MNNNKSNLQFTDQQTTNPTQEKEEKTTDIPQELFVFMENWVANTATETHKFLEQTTQDVGESLKSITDNSVVRSLNDIFGIEWLMAILGAVDVEKVQMNLHRLQQKYPDYQLEQLAQQIILEKSWEAARIGLITNIIPPVAAAMLGIELATTAKLQAEMIYEIAGAYGLELNEPARRGEVLAIFGLSLGAGVLKSGLSLVEMIPGVGAVIGASTNAMIFYGLGYTTCQFYEGKYKPVTSEDKSSQQKREQYWQFAYAQSQIMDEILTHMILASYPDEMSQSEILRDLEKVSPSSVKVVATQLENPQPLEQLLEQLSPDFASITLTRCYYLANLDGTISPQKQEILQAIADKFNIDLAAFDEQP